jgi:hypothetical protein
MNVDELLSQLQRVKPSGTDRWMALCPAHKDVRGRSLSIREDNGRILLHCFAGCEVLTICDRLGIELKQLMPPDRARPTDADEHRVPASALLEFFDHELTIAAHIVAMLIERSRRAGDVKLQRLLHDSEWDRLATARRRISNARALIAPAKIGRAPRSHPKLDELQRDNPQTQEMPDVIANRTKAK